MLPAGCPQSPLSQSTRTRRLAFQNPSHPPALASKPYECENRETNIRKPEDRRGHILFIDAVNDVSRERAQSSLLPRNQMRIVDAYRTFANESAFAHVAMLENVASTPT